MQSFAGEEEEKVEICFRSCKNNEKRVVSLMNNQSSL